MKNKILHFLYINITNIIIFLGIIVLIILYIINIFGETSSPQIIKETEIIETETQENLSTIELGVPTEALIETDQGEVLVNDIPTVEEVDGGMFEEGESFDDMGAVYDVATPEGFKNSTLGRCIIENNIYGAQCVSLARAFWNEYAGYPFSTCNTGSAKGAWKDEDCIRENARDKFDLVRDKNLLEAGDFTIFEGGLHGHVGMALGRPHNGYITLLGENQGGENCKEGGQATNIINISLKNFLGAYRPKIYNKPIVDTSH